MSRKNAVTDSLKIKNIMRSNLSTRDQRRDIQLQLICRCWLQRICAIKKCIICSSTATATDSHKLERLQERALRLVHNTTTESYDTMLKRAKLTTLQNRRLQDILILMFKVKNKLTMNYIADIFNINEENTNSKIYNLRNADFVLPRFKTVTYGRHSLRFLGPQLWSKLSKEERNIGTLATFRTMIRKKDVTSFLEGCGSECRLCLG